jgi:uncharacterized heparinase superfamily protein
VSLSARDSTEASGAFALPHTGYYGWRQGGDLLICDAGAIGPDYIPGHAHGDIFSFELSLSHRRIIVDAGIHDYDVSPMRSYCRSTLAHNTVELARQDQCEFWKAFRVARRGRPRRVRFQSSDEAMLLSGAHDAYRRLPGAPRHHRQFLYRREGVLIVRDRIESRSDCPAVSRLHLAPEVQLVAAVGNAVKLRSGPERICIRFAGPGQLRVKDSRYCPRFGQAVDNKVLEFRTGGRRIANMFCIARGLDDIPQSLLEPA